MLRVLSYNLHKGKSARGGASILAEAAAALRAREPDILLCQEVFHARDEPQGQAGVLADELGLDEYFGPNRFRRRGCHGNATLTRLEVREACNLDLTESLFERRGALHTRIATSEGPVDVLNVHLSLTHGQRRRQWRRLIEAAPLGGEGPVLVCGDFNDWHGRLDRRVGRSRSLINALRSLPAAKRRTYPARRPVFALDRVYFRGLTLCRVEVLRGEPWDRLSDHLPVEAELEVAG